MNGGLNLEGSREQERTLWGGGDQASRHQGLALLVCI